MDKIVIRTIPRKFTNGYLLVPATVADKKTLDMMCQSAGDNTVRVVAEVAKSKKSYDQVKTVFALIEIIFQIDNNRKPTEHEKALYYSYLLNQYGEKELVSVSGQEPVMQAIGLSSMTRAQATRFISSLMAHVCEHCQLPDYLIDDMNGLFEVFAVHKGKMEVDFADTDADGEYLSIDAWIKLNNCSHATGKTDCLEIAHIVSKGTAPQFRDCVWNFLRLTHDEHMEQHAKGWDNFIKLYPHIKGRVERAREMAGKLEVRWAPSNLADSVVEDIF